MMFKRQYIIQLLDIPNQSPTIMFSATELRRMFKNLLVQTQVLLALIQISHTISHKQNWALKLSAGK